MQSESPEATQSTSSDTATQGNPNSTQHGLHDRDTQYLSHNFGRENDGEVGLAAHDSDAVSVNSGSSSFSDISNSGRLSGLSATSAPGTHVGRIEQYENSLSRRHRKYGGIGFQVVAATASAKPRKSIEIFPNEVLTHILSHLPPTSLSAMSFVSKRFHGLITSPHAWRIAFSRYFPGQDSLAVDDVLTSNKSERFRSDKRSFSRLTALASWRSEYILRTRLLSSLRRGKPTQFQPAGRGVGGRASSTLFPAVTTYNSGLVYPVSHIHATWGTGLNKRMPQFVHGASEQGVVTMSDPSSSKAGSWGLGDFQAFKHFADIHVGESEYGLGSGDVMGMPNVLDVSQSYGKIYGEASPGGRAFYTSISEQRGRWLMMQSAPQHAQGVPEVRMNEAAICAVWIAKSDHVMKVTHGVFGMLAGTSSGVLAAYALGNNSNTERRFDKGELTAKWAICPGVPIIAVSVDEDVSLRRQSQRRIWAVLLNALGEVYYLSDVPVRPETRAKLGVEEVETAAWQTGRSVSWKLLEGTRRSAKVDPFDTAAVDGSYTPSSSPDSLGLSVSQLEAETKEIEAFLRHKPKHFRKICEGWDCCRRLLVDFAGNAGESILVVSPGLNEESKASVTRYMRRRYKLKETEHESYPALRQQLKRSPLMGSFEGMPSAGSPTVSTSSFDTPLSRCSSTSTENETCRNFRFEWHISEFNFSTIKNPKFSAAAIDESTFARLSSFEDPLLGMSRGSSASSPVSSPYGRPFEALTINEVPGQCARFMALGTSTGLVFVWDVRAKGPPAADIVNSVAPVNVIHTDSPEISCLAMTSLYLVHGGNDGLVQAWDPLASSLDPIRTLNSRFSSRARRRLVQAQNSVQGVGNNYYAAGAVTLDPDPTVLRGMVSMGTHLRYWSYSSSAADQYKSSKRRVKRRSARGSNASPGEQKFSHTGRGALKDYIANEQLELEREKASRQIENERLSGRFGVDLLGPGASEEEMIAYAAMLSEESYTSDEVKRRGSTESSSAMTSGSEKTIHDVSSPPTVPEVPSPPARAEDDLDPDVAEAIRLSLLDGQQESSEIPVSYSTKSKQRRGQQHSPTGSPMTAGGGSSKSTATREEENDLDFALQLSLAEENSRLEEYRDIGAETNEFPTLGGVQSEKQGKGKGRA
ncbi:MAG: hypothetical protein Q9227_006141 [Pyrenula ochraceoflavens]